MLSKNFVAVFPTQRTQHTKSRHSLHRSSESRFYSSVEVSITHGLIQRPLSTLAGVTHSNAASEIVSPSSERVRAGTRAGGRSAQTSVPYNHEKLFTGLSERERVNRMSMVPERRSSALILSFYRLPSGLTYPPA